MLLCLFLQKALDSNTKISIGQTALGILDFKPRKPNKRGPNPSGWRKRKLTEGATESNPKKKAKQESGVKKEVKTPNQQQKQQQSPQKENTVKTPKSAKKASVAFVKQEKKDNSPPAKAKENKKFQKKNKSPPGKQQSPPQKQVNGKKQALAGKIQAKKSILKSGGGKKSFS